MKLNKLQELSEKSVKLVTINFHHVTYKHFMGNTILLFTYDYLCPVTIKTLFAVDGLLSAYSGFYNPFLC